MNDYYGFTQGGTHGNQYTLSKEKVLTLANSNSPKNQCEFAESYGITQQTMNNYMRMAIGTLAYDTKEEVMRWMLDIQLGRRNLSPIQRIAVAEKYRPLYEKEAIDNQSKAGKEYGNGGTKLTANLSQALDQDKKERNPTTDKKLADIADVSEKTYRMGAKILNSDNEDLKKRVQTGEKSINAGYKELIQNKKKGKYI